MCGITGIVNTNGTPVDQLQLQKMNDLIAHRGPDGEGFYTSRNLGFGHRRLAIIDLTHDGHQPMLFQEKYVITFNGEIYNYIEIRNDLMSHGYQFKSKSDTEVILAAYDFWGEECVKQFNGMWAFAIYDNQKEILFCSRDRFGVKPFYYKESDTQFLFGSEIKQLINHEGKNEANADLIAHFLYTGMHDHEDRTFFKGIYKLPPSHCLTYDLKTNKKEIKKFYKIEKPANPNYEEVLTSAVKLRLRSDVKVGTCLSGGIDSSTIAAMASGMYFKESGKKFQAIHAQSIEKETDESEYAKEAAELSNIDMSIITPNPDEFKSVLEEVVYTQEEPFGGPSIYLQYFVMKKAREIGCKVMLDGQGGDETLLGYERYYAPAFLNYLKQKGLMASIKEVIASNRNNTKMSVKSIAKYLLGTFFLELRSQYARYKNSWFKKSEIPTSFPYLQEIKKRSLNLKDLQELELFTTNLQALLRYEDKNSMRHGIETRLPFIDYRSVETALNLDIDKKISNGWTKIELRRICEKYLSKNIAWRKHKLGFNAPDRSWLQTIIPEINQEINNSKILKKFIEPSQLKNHPVAGTWTITWRIYNVAMWERIYNVTI